MALIDNLIKDLKEIYKERFVSLVLYGSCVLEDCENEFSDLNTIVIIDSLSASDLKKASTAIRKFVKRKPVIKKPADNYYAYANYLVELLSSGICRTLELLEQSTRCHQIVEPNKLLPLFMDKNEWFNSCDVYPVEYADIKARYKILYGEDVVEPLILDKSNLRHQCEYEIKSALIKLRQHYLAKSYDISEIRRMLHVTFRSFFALFRGILRLTEDNAPFNHKEVIHLLAKKVNIDEEAFLKVLELKTNPKAIKKNEYEITVQKIINSIDEILKYVDKI